MRKRKSESGQPKQYSDPEGPPNFDELALHYPDFAKYVVQGKGRRPTIDWRDTEAVKCLTRAILFTKYAITLELPSDQLCPTVTLRANYIRFIQDLMSSEVARDGHTIKGLDIGTGASCIYPMLGVRMNPEWKFVGTDISKTSLDYAQKNIDKNGLSRSIGLRHQPNPEHVFKGVLDESDEQFSFTMCNPPFFSDISEACQNPNGTCTASDHEAVTDGGEEGFVRKMIQESTEFPTKVTWWTSMLGRKKSLKPLVKALGRTQPRAQIVTAELVQGKTTRWVLAWTFGGSSCECPRKKAAKTVSSSSPVTVFSSPLPLNFSEVSKAIEGWSKVHGYGCTTLLSNRISCTMNVDGDKVGAEFVIPEENNKSLTVCIINSGNNIDDDPNKVLEKHFKSITTVLCDLAKMLQLKYKQ